MTSLNTYILGFLALMTCTAAALAGVAFSAAPPGDGPLLVVAAPWSGGAFAVAERAGGQAIGPQSAPLSVLAAGAEAEAYRAAGAWAVLDPGNLPFFCLPEEF